MYERTVTVGSGGKSFSVTGWRVGWAVAPPRLTSKFRSQYTSMQPTPTQVKIKRFKNNWEDMGPFYGPFLVTSPLGFKARVGSIICTWQMHTCNTFHEIDLWCDTCQALGGQHANQGDLFHIPVSRHWWGSKLGSLMAQTNALLIKLYLLGKKQST